MGWGKCFLQLLSKVDWDLLLGPRQKSTRSGSHCKIIALGAYLRSDFEIGTPFRGYPGHEDEMTVTLRRWLPTKVVKSGWILGFF